MGAAELHSLCAFAHKVAEWKQDMIMKCSVGAKTLLGDVVKMIEMKTPFLKQQYTKCQKN